MKNKINIIGLVIASISVGITIYIVLFQKNIIELSSVWTSLLTGLFASVIALFTLQILRTFKAHNKSLTIALLGFPQTGKTVYLTVLFNELQKIKSGNIKFAPYGNETIEKVSKDISFLQKGKWLPKTEINQFFYYRATTTIGGLFKRNYKLEIGDFAGERFNDLSNINFNWLHRDKYFDYAIQSDAILLSISAIIFHDHDEKVEVINSTIAAINLLAQKMGYSEDHKMKEPIGLLILKSDILDWDTKDQNFYLAQINDLLVVCKKTSLSFKPFFVTSVGDLDGDKPSSTLQPHNVTESLLWLLNHEKS